MSQQPEHPEHDKADQLFTLAQDARRNKQHLAAARFEGLAAKHEAAAARAATTPFDRESFWRSAVAAAYHSGDEALLLALADEALAATSDAYTQRKITELLAAPAPNSLPVPRTAPTPRSAARVDTLKHRRIDFLHKVAA